METVSFFLPSFAGGGAERVLIDVANGFHSKGLNVQVTVGNSNGPARERLLSEIEVVDFCQPRVLAAIPSLVRYLRNQKPDVIYTTMMHANVMVSLSKILARVNTKVVIREAVSHDMQKQQTSAIGYAIWQLLSRFFYRKAHAVICVSSVLKQELLKRRIILESTHAPVIYNPLDPDYQEKQFEELVDAPSWLSQQPFILGLGRLNDQKGFDVLLKVAAELNKHQTVGVVILGDGELRAELESTAADLGLKDLHMPGFVSNPYPYLAACDCFALTSRFEGMPSALIQALSVGAKIVAANCPTGPSEVLEEGRWGALVEVDNVDGFVSAIQRAFDTVLPADDKAYGNLQRFEASSVIQRYHKAGL